jgi:hypothetical protein
MRRARQVGTAVLARAPPTHRRHQDASQQRVTGLVAGPLPCARPAPGRRLLLQRRRPGRGGPPLRHRSCPVHPPPVSSRLPPALLYRVELRTAVSKVRGPHLVLGFVGGLLLRWRRGSWRWRCWACMVARRPCRSPPRTRASWVPVPGGSPARTRPSSRAPRPARGRFLTRLRERTHARISRGAAGWGLSARRRSRRCVHLAARRARRCAGPMSWVSACRITRATARCARVCALASLRAPASSPRAPMRVTPREGHTCAAPTSCLAHRGPTPNNVQESALQKLASVDASKAPSPKKPEDDQVGAWTSRVCMCMCGATILMRSPRHAPSLPPPTPPHAHPRGARTPYM